MATTKFIIGKRGGDRPEVTIKLTMNSSLRVQTKVPGVLVYRQYWSEAKQCNDTTRKFAKPWEVEEMAQVNKTLAALAAEVLSRATATPEEDINKEWLAAEVDNILHPDKYAPKVERPKTLKEAIEAFIEAAPNKVVKRKGHPNGVHIAPRTIFQYRQLQNQVLAYLKAYNRDDMEVIELDEVFYNSFVNFLEKQGYKVNTIGYFIKSLKAVINSLPLAQRATCEFVAPKKCAKLTEEVDNIYLTEAQLEAIAAQPITAPYLDRVRDQFILLAWTGCRYSDLDKLNKKHISTMNGREYFKIVQQKTGAKVTIPVLAPVRAILEKYGYNLPRPIANQKFNEYVKEVAKLAGLKEWQRVTAHTARRSFATNLYKRDFPTLMIMRITGHQTEKAFLTYIKVTEDENAERMIKKFEEQEAHRLAPGMGNVEP